MRYSFRSIVCALCKWACPSRPPATPAPTPQPRFLNVDIHGPAEFTAVLHPEFFDPIVGERRVPTAPWHISFRVPGTVTGNAWVEVTAGDRWVASRTPLAVGGSPTPMPLTDTQCDTITVVPARPPARRGTPTLQNRVFRDAAGPYIAFGTSLFWAPWAWMHDRAKLDANLQYLQGRVDYIRVLLVTGPGGLWDRRLSLMSEVMAHDVLTQLATHAYETYGIRVMPTIFGATQGTPAERAAFVRYVGRACAQLGEKIHHLEVANEADNNGFERDEILAHAALLRTLTPHEVALTAPTNADWAEYYEGSAATLMTLHLERNITGTGGRWRPVRQAREGEMLGRAWSSNEPIGIASSVAADDDPLRLTMAAAVTWLCRGASYVLHTGAGIYGIDYAGPTGPRCANLYEQPTLDATLAGIQTMRTLLPPDLPNWRWVNNNPNFPDYPFNTDPLVQEDRVLRSFAAFNGQQFVCLPIRIAQQTPYIARRNMTFTHYDPLTGAVINHVTLSAGEAYIVPGEASGNKAAIFIGTFT